MVCRGQKSSGKVDPRLAQNVALSKFAKSDCRDGGALLASLSALLAPVNAYVRSHGVVVRLWETVSRVATMCCMCAQ